MLNVKLIMVVVFAGFLTSLGCSKFLAAENTLSISEESADKIYNHFLFIKRGEDANGNYTNTYALMMATIKPGSLEVKQFYDAGHVYKPLCVVDGIAYFLSAGKLMACDVESGWLNVVDINKQEGYSDKGKYDVETGILYINSGSTLLTYDCHNKTFINGEFLQTIENEYISPDKKKAAFFSGNYANQDSLNSANTVLYIRDIATRQIKQPCPAFKCGFLSYSDPQAWRYISCIWLDNENLIFSRIAGITGNGDSYITKANIATGTLTDVIQFPKGTRSVILLPSTLGSGLVAIGTKKYRIDLQQGKIIETDTIKLGVFTLCGGGYYSNYGLYYPDAVYDGDKLVSSLSIVSVAPDGNQAIFIVNTGGRMSKGRMYGSFDVRYYDSRKKELLTVSDGWSTGPFVWFTDADLKKP